MKTITSIFWFLCTVLAMYQCTSAAQPELQHQPNIVFILVDDLGWSDLACYGHAWHETPHIDQLAKDGQRFTNAYSPAPICSASRASILTGKAVARLGFEFVTKDSAGHQQLDTEVPLQTPPYTLNLPLSETTSAELLRELNYQTAFFGKWHVSQHYQRYLGWHPQFGPHRQGFEVAIEDFGDHPYSWSRTDPPPDASDGHIPPDSMVQQVCKFIRSEHERPFFAMASSFYVHTPVKTRCRWLVERYETRIPQDVPNRSQRLQYAAFVETLDHHVGQIVAAIEQAGLTEDTLVVFMSDNGGHPEFSSNAPLRGSKWNLYEGGIRVPLITRWPKEIQASGTCDLPVIGYDLLSTFVDIAGGQIPAAIDGVSIRPAFQDPNWRINRSLIWHFPYYHPETKFSQAATQIGVADFRVSQTRPQSALRKGPYKLIRFAEDERMELYDLEQDISETNELSARLPLIAQRLGDELEATLSSMQARRAHR